MECKKICYVQCCGGILHPLTLTNSTQFLQALKGRLSIGHLSSPSVASARTSSRCWRSFSGDRSTAENSICGRTASSLNWSSRVVCLRLAARAYHPQQTSATYARSSAGPRSHYLDAPKTQPSSARLRRQQAGRGRLKPGARQSRACTALGAQRFPGLPLQNCHVSSRIHSALVRI